MRPSSSTKRVMRPCEFINIDLIDSVPFMLSASAPLQAFVEGSWPRTGFTRDGDAPIRYMQVHTCLQVSGRPGRSPNASFPTATTRWSVGEWGRTA
jgi:hypothetical protein